MVQGEAKNLNSLWTHRELLTPFSPMSRITSHWKKRDSVR